MLTELQKFDLSKFRPSRGTQDKRDRESIVKNCNQLVSHGLYKKAIPLFTMVPDVDSKRRYSGNLVSFPPGTPLEQFYIDNKEAMDRAMKESLLLVVQAKQAFRENKVDKVKDIFGVGEAFGDSDDNLEKDTDPVTKPSKPVMGMVQEEVVQFYSIFLKDLYKITLSEDVKPKLWAKWQDGKLVSSATPLKYYDEFCENILPRDSYLGRGTYKGSNLGSKLQIVIAYIFFTSISLLITIVSPTLNLLHHTCLNFLTLRIWMFFNILKMNLK